MKEINSVDFFDKLSNKLEYYPFSGQIELTYRCGFNCVHCYCKGSENNGELTTKEWKNIFDEIHKEGCIWLTLTGGDPLIKNDFLELYSYCKEKGFVITIFTTGYGFSDDIVNYLKKSPPYSIEITLNGITQRTYETITRVKNSFNEVIYNIKKIKENKLPLILKSNCLKENKDEIGKIKTFTDELLGKPSKNTYHFKYDPMIYPRLNCDKAPCRHRLSEEELQKVRYQDYDIWQECQRNLKSPFPDLERDGDFLYQCNVWMTRFFVNPFGKLKFCNFSDKFSVDLKTASFREGFYNFSNLLEEKFKTDSSCRRCSLRSICYYCPARAYLETGNEDGPVSYYCELAKWKKEQMDAARRTSHAPRL